VGQFPSLADIANDESKIYRDVLKDDSSEFHKAIGLAAHGVGIGSYVYMRRIFERLIKRRFDEFRAVEGWSEEEFRTKRMDEKIQFLKDHLPPFLVEHARLYLIMSLGVHELNEQECLSYFDVIKHAIIIILEEDKEKKKQLAMREKFSEAIKTFSTRPKTGKPETETH
jgi:hypothetical protein